MEADKAQNAVCMARCQAKRELSLRIKDLLGPVTRVKKKKKQ